VAATRLPGAADFATVGALHSFLMSNPEVIAMTRRFLAGNTLHESGAAAPIPIPAKPAHDSTAGADTP
jgi:hypothetical protein